MSLVSTNELKTNKAAAIAANTTVIATSFRPVLCVIDLLRSSSDSRLIPSGVISNAHEKIKATENQG